MHLRFVVNPVAGRRTSVPYVRKVMEHLGERGLQSSIYVTRFAGDGRDHAQALDEGVDRVVVAGGDGTLAEVVNGLGPLRCPVGVIPMGTANLVARETRMPTATDPRETANALAGAARWRVDMMRTRNADGERYSLATVGVGADASVVHALEDVRNAPGMGGYARWAKPITDTLIGYRPLHLRVHIDERRTYAAAACIVQNTRNYGGMFRLSPAAAMDSGTLDVMLMRIVAPRDLIRVMAGALLRCLPRYHDMKFVRGDRVRIESRERAPVQADGDAAGFSDIDIQRLPAALDLLRAPPRG